MLFEQAIADYQPTIGTPTQGKSMNVNGKIALITGIMLPVDRGNSAI